MQGACRGTVAGRGKELDQAAQATAMNGLANDQIGIFQQRPAMDLTGQLCGSGLLHSRRPRQGEI